MFLESSAYSEKLGLQKFVYHSQGLGTQMTFTVFHNDQKLVQKAIDDVLAEIELVEALMSIYRPESQLSQLNREGVLRDPHPLFIHVLKRAQELSNLTNGAFDITVQPLWNLFKNSSLKGRIPQPPISRGKRKPASLLLRRTRQRRSRQTTHSGHGVRRASARLTSFGAMV